MGLLVHVCYNCTVYLDVSLICTKICILLSVY